MADRRRRGCPRDSLGRLGPLWKEQKINRLPARLPLARGRLVSEVEDDSGPWATTPGDDHEELLRLVGVLNLCRIEVQLEVWHLVAQREETRMSQREFRAASDVSQIEFLRRISRPGQSFASLYRSSSCSFVCVRAWCLRLIAGCNLRVPADGGRDTRARLHILQVTRGNNSPRKLQKRS